MAIHYAERLAQRTEGRSWIEDAFVVLGASVIIALFAPLVIRLPFTPVPIGLQVDVVLFLAALMGSRRGALAVLAFLAQGALGLPVFAGGAADGLARFIGPTGGYLIGYVLGAYLTGMLVERMKERKVSSTFFALGVGHLAVFACGLPQLSLFVGSIKAAFLIGVLPFLPGALVKIVLVLRALKSLRFFKNATI